MNLFNFVIPNIKRFAKIKSINDIDTNQEIFSDARASLLYQSYIILENKLGPCVMASEQPLVDAINIALTPDIEAKVFRPDIFVVGVRADKSPSKLAHCEIVQNPTVETQRSFYLPLWPQPGLKRRDLNRKRVETIAYAGFKHQEISRILVQLALDLYETNLRVIMRDKKSCADLTDIDLLLAIRSFDGDPQIRKPPSKLVNGWIANIPVLATPEIGYQTVGLAGSNYLEVRSREDLRDAVLKLSNDPSLYDRIKEEGALKSLHYSRESIAVLWEDTLRNNIIPLFEKHKASRLIEKQFEYFLRRISGISRWMILGVMRRTRRVAGRVINALLNRLGFMFRVLCKGRVVLKGASQIYRLTFKHACDYQNKIVSATANVKYPPWNNINCILPQSFALSKRMIFSIQNRKGTVYAQSNQFHRLVINLLTAIPSGSPRKIWRDTLSQPYFDGLLNDLESPLRVFIDQTLGDLMLPVTGAHGDFHVKNITWDSSEAPFVIDWEGFRENGSCVEDACGLILSASWARNHQYIKDPKGREPSEYTDACMLAIDRGDFSIVSQNTTLSEMQCAVLAAISRSHIGDIAPSNRLLALETLRAILKKLRSVAPYFSEGKKRSSCVNRIF